MGKVNYYRFSALVLGLGFAVFPLFYWDKAPVPFEVPRVEFIIRWTQVLAAILIFFILFKGKTGRFHLPILASTACFLIVAIVSSIVGVDLGKSIAGNYFRADGLITLLHMVIFSLTVAFIWKKSLSNVITYATTAGIFLVSLFSLYDFHLSGNLLNPVASIFGNPNFLAGYMAVTLPITFYGVLAVPNRIGKLLLILVLLLQHIVILLTFSLGGFLGIFLFWCFELTSLAKSVVLKRLVIIVTACVLLITAVFYVKSTTSMGFVAESRERIFNKLVLSIQERPLLGWGWANVDKAFSSSVWPIPIENDVYVDKAHSTLLEVITTTGILGMTAYLLIIFFVIKRLYFLIRENPQTYWYKTLLITFVIYLVHSQTNIISISEEVFFWLILGIVTSDDHE